MGKTYYEIYLGWHFAKNEVAYKAAIDSAVDYAWKNNVDSVHIQAEYPDIVRDLGYEFSEVICSYGQPTVFVLPLKSVHHEDEKVPSAKELKNKRSDSELLIMAYIANKVNTANELGWCDVFIPHRIPDKIQVSLSVNKNYKFKNVNNGTVISWEEE